MKARMSPLLAWFVCGSKLFALDYAQIPESNAEAFKAAVVAEGGFVEGEPYLATEAGPDGKPTKVIVFPQADCFVSLPVASGKSPWKMSGSLLIKEFPYRKASGSMFGVIFGRNDSVLAIVADKWSKLSAPLLISGNNNLITEEQFNEAKPFVTGQWQSVTLELADSAWKLKIGDAFEKNGTVEKDERGALLRSGMVWMRVGNFAGSATIPTME